MRAKPLTLSPSHPIASPQTRPESSFQLNPYVDYGRYLTAEGGILLVYKDLDLRWRHMIWRLFAWVVATGWETWFVSHHSPVHSTLLNLACLLVIAVINRLIVRKPIEVYRRVEFRPDCLILEGSEVFWAYHMENGWPALRPDGKGNQILCGIYGTRFVEYVTLRRFDEMDRMPEVLAAHIQDAMTQLWTKPQ